VSWSTSDTVHGKKGWSECGRDGLIDCGREDIAVNDRHVKNRALKTAAEH